LVLALILNHGFIPRPRDGYSYSTLFRVARRKFYHHCKALQSVILKYFLTSIGFKRVLGFCGICKKKVPIQH
jgi:hypothetical protein